MAGKKRVAIPFRLFNKLITGKKSLKGLTKAEKKFVLAQRKRKRKLALGT